MSVRFGGVYLGGANQYEFELAVGVNPVEKFWTVSAERAAGIDVGKPLDLEVSGSAFGKVLNHQRIYALEVLPATNPKQRVLHVADCRWLWPRKHVASSFNVRRTTGDRFLVNNTDNVENAVVQPDLAYAKWSLYPPDNGSTPWTARQILEEVFRQLEQPVRFVDELPHVEVQDLDLEDAGHAAVDRVLGYLPGVDVYIDLDGTAVVFNTGAGGVGSTLGPPGQGAGDASPDATIPTQTRGPGFLSRKHTTYPGDVQEVSRKVLRPKNVHILFTPEVELRVDFSEGATRARDEPTCTNVAPVPDVTLTLSDGQTVARGSYVALEDLFSAWGAFGLFNREMSVELMRKNSLKHGWASFEQEFGNDPTAPPNVVNMQRAATAVENWRRTFQIDPTFVQRVSSIRAVRVAILNTETGLYAPAEVFTDWTRRPTMRGLAYSAKPNESIGWAVEGWAANIADAKTAPARVTIEDEGAGVFRVHPQVDPYGLSQAMVLGYPAAVGSAPAGTVPSQDLGAANRQRQDLYAQWDRVELSETFNLSAILTVVPASPNDARKFHKVTISAGEAGAGEAVGPDLYVRVYPGVMTARFAWTDVSGQAIVDAIRGRAPNLPPEALVNGSLVQAVAMATAKRAYTQWRDMPGGSAAVDMNPEIKPHGNVRSVRHVMTGGVTETVVNYMDGVRRPVDIWPFLDSSSRRAILRVLHEGQA